VLAAAAGGQADGLLLLVDELAEPSSCALAQLDCLEFQFEILRLPGVSLEGDRLVADVLHLVDRRGFGNRTAGRFISNQFGQFCISFQVLVGRS